MFSKVVDKARKKLDRLKELGIDIRYCALGSLPESVRRARGLRILVYHGVCTGDPYKLNSRFVSVAQLNDHLALLKKYCNLISFEDLKTGNLTADKLNVLLTFDDGYRNNLTLALPVLRSSGAPAVFFVTAAGSSGGYLYNDIADLISFAGPDRLTIDNKVFKKRFNGFHWRYLSDGDTHLQAFLRQLSPDARQKTTRQLLEYLTEDDLSVYREYLELMNADDILSLSRHEGVTIGSHGFSHSDLARSEAARLDEELFLSKNFVETATGMPCDLIAFPYGSHDIRTLDAAQRQGYGYFFGTEKTQQRKNLFARETVNPYISAANQLWYIVQKRQ